ncbi:MAG: type III pantothenate kinase, partial [Flavobacterium sp.]
VIDLGNTFVKIAVFELDKLFFKKVADYSNWEKELQNIFQKYPKIKNIVACSVVNRLQLEELAFLKEYKIHFISSQSHFPFINNYETPETLGIDRMVLAAGAVLKYPKQDCLIIDAGTCITYDFITSSGNYLGGAISPGIQLRYKSLHDYTAKLPLLEPEMPNNQIGRSTKNAIHSGVINGILYEIENHITAFSANKKNFIIILTGGDAVFLAKRLKNTIFANSNFLLESLYHLYQFQQK